MKPPIKLSSIDREHLQELYEAAGVPRDDLPYTPAFEQLVQGFQDRTFKNADPEQVFVAILKHVRSSTISSSDYAAAGGSGGGGGDTAPVGSEAGPALTEEQLKQLKTTLSRHAPGGKVLPYTDAFTASRNDFNKQLGRDMSEHEFWRAILRLQGAKRRPPVRKKAAVAARDDEDDE